MEMANLFWRALSLVYRSLLLLENLPSRTGVANSSLTDLGRQLCALQFSLTSFALLRSLYTDTGRILIRNYEQIGLFQDDNQSRTLGLVQYYSLSGYFRAF